MSIISFREIEITDAKMILDWRVSKRVSRNLITEVDYNINKQTEWIKNCYNREDFYHWIIDHNKISIGYISLSNYSFNTDEVSFGVFIGEDDYLNFGAVAMFYFYNFVFNSLNKNKINIEVFYFNLKTIELHLSCGYEFNPKNDRIVLKKNKKELLVSMNLEKKDWIINKRYSKFKSDFPSKKRTSELF